MRADSRSFFGTGMVDCSSKKGYFVYILECSDGTLYTGWTVHPDQRLRCHNQGRGGRYTRSRLPVRMVWVDPCPGKSAAMKREADIKKLSRAEKLAIIGRQQCMAISESKADRKQS